MNVEQDMMPNDPLASEIDLGRPLRFLRRWYRLILLCGILAGLAGLALSYTAPRAYRAAADVAIVRSAAVVNFDSGIRTISDTDPSSGLALDQLAFRTSLTTIGSSADLAERVLDKIGAQLQSHLSAEILAKRVTVNNDGLLITIGATGASPEQAALIANTWAEVYVTRINEIFVENPISAELLGSQLKTAKLDYEQKQAQVVAYLAVDPTSELNRALAEKRKIIENLQTVKDAATQAVINAQQQVETQLLNDYLKANTGTRSAVLNEQVNARNQELADLYDVRTKLNRLLFNARALRDRLAASQPAVASGDQLALLLLEGSTFSTWADLPVNLSVPLTQLTNGANLAEQQAQLDTLIAQLERNVQETNARIDDKSKALLAGGDLKYLDEVMEQTASPLRDAIQSSIKSLLQVPWLEEIVTNQSLGETVTNAVQRTQNEINQLQAKIETENAKKQELTRARDLAWSTYNTLATRQAEVNIANQANSGVVRVATLATADADPVSANRVVQSLAAAVLGLVIGTILALVLELRNNRLRTAEDAAMALDLPVLGAVPASLQTATMPRAMVMFEPSPPPAQAEAYRLLRYHVLSSGRRTLALTTPTAGEAADALTANLAAAVAQAGNRVLLVDTNLRAPVLQKLLNFEKARGLTGWISEETADWRSFVQATSAEGLGMIPAGAPPSDPGAMLEGPALKRLIDQARAEYDFVMVNAPPVLGIADALAVARGVEGVILLVDSQTTTRREAEQARAELKTTDTPLVGVVLNRIRASEGAVGRRSSAPASPGEPRGAWWTGFRDRLVGLVGPQSG